ncbi:aldo/keto reductase [Furfurilactobacillus siliginis]|uniref:Oxidoreductase n=1 Tax=Furfurilactobacillus siliginis TaxID=348151 RepID=A0A0R2L6E9_9LACO|nr:aldo/keto reductase [Furfurilactobacillus siliginis]KRN95430.1 oxidoreductase [Furfurilactobacillus siliginis]GEK28201.1 oxidoreductase [Furfurilactobacillus siliginis]
MTAKTFTFDEDLTVNRLGYGTMQLPGAGVWGPSKDPENAVDVMTAVLNSDVDFIDTADAYGPLFANQYLKQALQAYQGSHKMIATKVGFTRQGPDVWTPLGNPAYLRQQIEQNLFSLGLDYIDLMQLHRIDANYSLADQLGVLADMQREGKIKHVGLSQVSVKEIEAAQEIVPIVSVQNRYNLIERTDEVVLKYAEQHHLAFIPWFPLATGALAKQSDGPLQKIAKAHHAVPSQIALAWLLQRSDVILPIPGTANLSHFFSNTAASSITLSEDEFKQLTALGSTDAV